MVGMHFSGTILGTLGEVLLTAEFMDQSCLSFVDCSGKVEEVIVDGTWEWPDHPVFKHIADSTPFAPAVSWTDYWRWQPCSNGLFTSASAWEVLRVKHEEVH